MYSSSDLLKKFGKALDQESFSGSPIELYQPIAYTMQQGGKRMRPLLLMMACDLFGGNPDDTIFPAIAIELFHNFTLIHDDIMDKATLRRGKETVYQKWNEDIAILSGDTMFALANKYLAKSIPEKLPQLLEVFNQTAVEVCEGQQLDMNFERQDNISIRDYLHMISLKTAAFLGCSGRLGAIIAGASRENVEHIGQFGINLGMAFQLKDDLLDAFGDEKFFGKRTGGDIASNKKTFLYLKALELADEDTKMKLKDLYLNAGVHGKKKIEDVIDIFTHLELDRHTEAEIKTFYDLAFNALNMIKMEETNKSVLEEFANTLMNRKR